MKNTKLSSRILLLRNNIIALVIFVLFFIVAFINAADETITPTNEDIILVICHDKTLHVVITGTKTKTTKLRKVINSEKKMFADMNENEGITHIKKILQDTGLFDSVKAELNAKNEVVVTIEDAYTLLPIINFSTNLQNFSYTAGVSESNLFHDMWQVAGAWSESSSSNSLYYSLGVTYPTDSIQSISASGVHGDSFFYYKKKWYQFNIDDIALGIRFKDIINQAKFNYGLQLRYTQFEFLDDPTLSTSAFMSYGKFYRNHDISEGYQFNLNLRYIEDRYNKYTFYSGFQKNWYIPLQSNTWFRGFQLDYQIDYSNIEEDRSAVGTIFAFRGSTLHGIRGNSVFERNFGTTGFRLGVTSQKFLWTYWQPHIFLEAGLSDHDRFYSVGGGLLLTFPALYNSRLRIQYYTGELPDKLSGIIISTTLDF